MEGPLFIAEHDQIEASKRDIKAFKLLYEKYHPVIFRYVMRRVGDESLTADITDQVFFQALTKLKQFTWQGKPFVSWLYVIAQNGIRKHFRNSPSIRYVEYQDVLWSSVDGHVEDTIDPVHQLESLLQTLTESQLELIEMKFLENYTYEEMAEILGLGESAIKMRIHRIIEQLRKEASHEKK